MQTTIMWTLLAMLACLLLAFCTLQEEPFAPTFPSGGMRQK